AARREGGTRRLRRRDLRRARGSAGPRPARDDLRSASSRPSIVAATPRGEERRAVETGEPVCEGGVAELGAAAPAREPQEWRSGPVDDADDVRRRYEQRDGADLRELREIDVMGSARLVGARARRA